MLIIENLSKKFKDRTILDAVSLRVNTGEIAVLLGQSGVGKSTLLRILNGLETADAGTVSVDGKVLDLSAEKHNQSIGMIFQQWNLFDHLTVEENITLPLEKVLHYSKTDAKATAHKLLNHFGLETKSQDSIMQLSGGQKQRLAIARAVALSPTVLCADEPTSALDPFLTGFVAKNIQQLAQEGLTLLVASHDISLVFQLRCTIYLMEAGKIVESAQSEDFRVHKQRYPRINDFVGDR